MWEVLLYIAYSFLLLVEGIQGPDLWSQKKVVLVVFNLIQLIFAVEITYKKIYVEMAVL